MNFKVFIICLAYSFVMYWLICAMLVMSIIIKIPFSYLLFIFIPHIFNQIFLCRPKIQSFFKFASQILSFVNAITFDFLIGRPFNNDCLK